MLIGIDASRAVATQRTGTEKYALHLIRELLALSDGHRFRLYFRQAPPAGLFAPYHEERVISFPRLWTHLALSREMLADPPDLLFVPSHVLPLIHPRRSVVTVHDLGYHYYPEAHTAWQNFYLRWSTRHNARGASRILADSQATRRDLVRYYRTPPAKITVVYPGLDGKLAPVSDPALLAGMRAAYGLEDPYLLYVGTLQPRKNLVRLIQAYARLRSLLADQDAPLPTPRLVLAGKKGWLYDEIVSQVQTLGLEGQVILAGYVPEADLPALLSGALAFVFPSLYEGFGLPVLEAMACGTPVICSDTSSLPEVAGDAALLVNPREPEALAQAMLGLLRDEELRGKLAARGLQQARRFSWRRCAQEALAVLDEVAGAG
jgi:glycosyltransferase involved in cell wall biosynthesis